MCQETRLKTSLIPQIFEEQELSLKSSFATSEWYVGYGSPMSCDWCEIVICSLK